MNESTLSVTTVLPDTQSVNEIISCIMAERINNLNIEETLENHTDYQKMLAKYMQLQKESFKPEVDFDTVDEIESCRNFICQLFSEAAYLQGMKDGLCLLAFAGTANQLTLFGSENFCLNNDFNAITHCDEATVAC